MKRLCGKNIVVTGGTSGIGRMSAIKLAEHGANVIVSGRDEKRGELLAQEIRLNNGQIKFIKCDVTNKNEVENLFNFAISYFGSIDCLFNNAGIEGEIASFSDSTEKNWDSVINTNLKGVWYCMKNAIYHMLLNSRGNILNMSSTSGLVGNGFGM